MSTEARPFNHIRVTILDSVGCGFAWNRARDYLRDIDIYDRSKPENRYKPITPVNTLVNASKFQAVNAPALEQLGITRLPDLKNLNIIRHPDVEVIGACGELKPNHIDNGSPAGHQALMGHLVDIPYMYFDKKPGFPPEIVDLVKETVSKVLKREVEIIRYPGKDDVSGVPFINTPSIGERHVASAKSDGPIAIPIYASSDSLIQIALHEDVVPYDKILEIGQAVRDAVNQKGYRIARIIMRPFENDPDHKDGPFKRIKKHRKDFGMDPDGPTLLNHLADAGIPIDGYGKAASMFNFSGFPEKNVIFSIDGEDKMRGIVADFSKTSSPDPLFSLDNITEFDEEKGHRNKPKEYIEYLNMIAKYIAQGMLAMKDNAPDDLWIITADHGNDPAKQKHNNHTNEKVPLFVYSPKMKKAVYLGVRGSFADVAKTIAENYGLADKIKSGKSFLKDLLKSFK